MACQVSAGHTGRICRSGRPRLDNRAQQRAGRPGKRYADRNWWRWWRAGAAQSVRRGHRADRRRNGFPGVQWASLGTLRTVARFVAVTKPLSPLRSDVSRTTILLCRRSRQGNTKEGGWNRKIRRATIFRRRATRKIGKQNEGPRPRGVAARRPFRYPMRWISKGAWVLSRASLLERATVDDYERRYCSGLRARAGCDRA